MATSLHERIGVDVGSKMSVEEAVRWAKENDVHYIDVCLDGGVIDPEAYDAETVDAITSLCDEHDISLGLHTVSSVNVAETAPYVGEGVDKYLRAYVDVGTKTGADRIIVHGGYHFADDALITQDEMGTHERVTASIDRLNRLAEYVPEDGPTLLLENHNAEPEDSELQYMPVKLEECENYFEQLETDVVKWCFNAPHARLFPEGMDGYVERLGADLAQQVRINDNNGEVEEHLKPGEGDLDFAGLFDLLETDDFDGHYMMKFGTLDEMLESREYLVDLYH